MYPSLEIFGLLDKTRSLQLESELCTFMAQRLLDWTMLVNAP
jgi:hypothetical protein